MKTLLPTLSRHLLSCALSLALLPLWCMADALAQTPGELDTSFATGPGADQNVLALALQPNGQALVAGSFSTYDGSARSGIARLNADGSLDTFNPGLALTGYSGGPPTIAALGLQPDGSVIVAGIFDVEGQTAGSGVARLTAAGGLDSTFDAGSGIYDDGGSVGYASAVAVLANGQILIGGAFTSFNGVPLAGLARLNSDGSVDPTFNPGGSGITGNGYGVNGGDVTSIVLLANGQFLIGGHFNAYNGTAAGCVARLNANGTLDPTFADGTGPDEGVFVLAAQANGQVLVGGGFNNFDGVAAPNIVRLNTDGSLDTSYDPDANTVFAFDEVSTIVLQPDGSAIIGGNFYSQGGLTNSPANGVARLLEDGTLDTTFDAQGGSESGQATALALQPDGELLVASNVTGPDSNGEVYRLYDIITAVEPTMTLVPGVPVTDENSGVPATFILKLSAAQTHPVVVHYAVQGTARAGFNYRKLSGQATIPAGKTSKTIDVTPINHGINSGAKLIVKLTLEASSSYKVGSAKTVKIKVVENH